MARTNCIYWMRPNVSTHMLCITSPPVCLHVSASHQLSSRLNRLADKKLPREKTASTAHKAQAQSWIQKRKLTLASAVLSSPQQIQCVRHPSVIISALCLVSVILPPFAGWPSVSGVCLSVGLLACRRGELGLCCSWLRTIRTKWWRGSHNAPLFK